ncbi:glycine oxidase ThiO [Paenibacillus sp. IB182496]|uniref:glycine oxidase n=1 Tax=Paenibacillus sabuli TaxID=2772509 RepID=A0A927GUB8_9BACL|nr:glycine oxidase ThiO [Paenibacillus sabuli]MBD2848191.1 glycine oxidase ThiO [Paenibacillus sabuli]
MKPRLLVLGGGIIGLACAYAAQRRGWSVTLVEPGELGGQASGAAAGMLAPFTENPDQPDDFFRLCQDSLQRYPAWLEELERATGIEVQYRRTGSLSLALHEADLLHLRARWRWQTAWGARAELLDGAQLRRLEPQLGAAAIAALYSPAESHVYAPLLVQALELACRGAGVRLIAQAGAISGPEPGYGHERIGLSGGETLTADKVLVCAGAWTTDYAAALGLRLPVHPIRGQICAYRMTPGTIRHMLFSSQAYWVEKANGTLVCGASEDVAGYDTRVTARGIDRLVRVTPRLLPQLEGAEPAHRWAGLRPATVDGRPLLGPVPGRPRVLVAAGHYRNGILLAPATAEAIAELLEEREPALPLADFAPGRFARGASSFTHGASSAQAPSGGAPSGEVSSAHASSGDASSGRHGV